jgi:LEA14-like dessication related protein
MPPLAIVALVGVGLYALSTFQKANAVQSMNLLITSVNPTFSGITPILDINILVQNPSDKSFVIHSMVGSVYVNDDYVANVSTFNQVTINPHAETVITLKARLSLAGLLDEIIDIINGTSGLQAVIRFTGKVNIDDLTIPVDIDHKII